MTMRSFLGRAMLCAVAVGLPLSVACNSKKVNSANPNLLATVRVSIGSANTQGNNDAVASDRPGISETGRYIAFATKASNLVGNDANNAADIYLRDVVARTTVLVSVDSTATAAGIHGGGGIPASSKPGISGDGRYVVFASKATNLTGDNTGGFQQIFVRDMQLGLTTLVSRASGPGLIANGDCDNPQISLDGNYVVFDTVGTNLDGDPALGDDQDAIPDVYRRFWNDTSGARPTILISMASGSASGVLNKGNANSLHAVLSADGRYVAFESAAANLVLSTADGGPDLNGNVDVFVRDAQTNRTVKVSARKAGAPQPDPGNDGESKSPTISSDGQVVVFRSLAANLHPDDDGTTSDIFLRRWNLVAPTTEILSVHTSGAQAGSSCDFPWLSGDGTKVSWASGSSNLVNGDANSAVDIFLRDISASSTSRISVSTFGNELNALSGVPRISANGRYVVFYTEATNASDDDINGASDIFLRGPPF